MDLKHITGYLPFGLKVNTIENELISIDLKNNKLESLFRGHLINIYDFDDFKPILRPLSDLTKEIEVNGEKFVPIFELSNYTIQQTENGKSGLEWNIISTFPYRDIQKLYEWHFDIHELIEKGEAIDINK